MNPRSQPIDDPIAAIETWREQGAALIDPVGFAVVSALARRAAAQQGEARCRLILRVEALLSMQPAFRPTVRSGSASDAPEVRRAVLAGLSDLVDRLGRVPSSRVPPASAPHRDSARQDEATSSEPPGAGAAPALRKNALTAFKGTWSRLRVEQRLRQALAQVPAMAGPLNSSHVMNRTLLAMRELSPEYLDAFMLHVDTLLWLEQVSGGDLPMHAATPAAGRRPGARAVRKA
jgi:hypothetical protein